MKEEIKQIKESISIISGGLIGLKMALKLPDESTKLIFENINKIKEEIDKIDKKT